MTLDVFPAAQRSADAFVAAQPGFGGPGLETNFEEAFGSAWGSVAGTFRETRIADGRYQAVNDWLDKFEAATGFRPENPEAMQDSPAVRKGYSDLATAYDTAKKQKPDLPLSSPPDEATAHETAIEAERRLMGEAAAVGARPGGFGKFVGGNLGTIAGTVVDPINLASVAVGGLGARGVIAVLAREAAIGAGSQGVISAGTFATNRQVDPEYGVGDALTEVAFAGAGGAILAGAGKGLGAIWSKLRTGNWPRYVRDAGNVVERADAVAASTPYRTAGIEGEIAHAQNFKAAEAAVVEGKQLDLPNTDLAAGDWRPSTVYAADGQGVDVKYQVVEANTLITSHNADMSANPAYPPELQPRDRTRAMSTTQIAEIASRLEPARLGPSPDAGGGAPIVGPDNLVESGNGRVLAIRQAIDAGGERAVAYRGYLDELGFKTEGMTAPVLIARRTSALDDAGRVAFTNSANRATALRLSAVEQALADARLIDGAVLDTLTQKGVGTQANAPFIRGFLSKLPQAERGGLMDRRGNLSQEGIRRAEAALLARAYGEPVMLSRLLEDTDQNVKAIGGALTDVAGSWAGLRDAVAGGRVPAGMDITSDLLAAVALVQRARDTGAKLTDLVDQAEMFEAPSPLTRALLRLMFRNEDLTQAASRQAVARGLSGFAEEARKNTTDDRLFGEPLGTGDVLSTALAKAGREDLMQAAEAATAPMALIDRVAEPVTDDAVIHDVEHLLADEMPDLAVPVRSVDEFGAETVTMRPVRQMLDDADAEIAAAKEIEACASGAMPAAAA